MFDLSLSPNHGQYDYWAHACIGESPKPVVENRAALDEPEGEARIFAHDLYLYKIGFTEDDFYSATHVGKYGDKYQHYGCSIEYLESVDIEQIGIDSLFELPLQDDKAPWDVYGLTFDSLLLSPSLVLSELTEILQVSQNEILYLQPVQSEDLET